MIKRSDMDTLSHSLSLDVTMDITEPFLEGQTFPLLDNIKVKLRISHHTMKKSECSLTQSKELVFVLDAPKEEERPKKKQKKNTNGDTAGVTVKNFGASLQIPKVKTSNLISIGWRCRLDSQGDGGKVLMPVRPVAILNGLVELDNQIINLM